MPLIDFSKIRIKGTPSKAAAPSIPSKGRRIDFSAIKFPPISAPKQTPVRQKPAPVVAKSSTPFIGRPLVTPVEQQRMKAAVPTPPAIYNPQKYNPEVTPVAPLLQTAAVKRWSAEAAAARKATPEIGQRLLDGMDSFTKIIQPNITPSDQGRNTVADFVGSIATVAAGVYAVKSLLGVLGAGVQYLKTPRSVADRETTTLFPSFDDSFHAQKYVLHLQQTDPAAAERFKSDLTTLLAQTMAKASPTTLSDESLQKSASLMYDFLVSNGQAGSFATVGERVASVATAASNLAAAVGNPQMSLAVATQATSQLAKTGMLQLLPSLAIANRSATIPMPAGLVHSTAPAIPMGGKIQPAAAISKAEVTLPSATSALTTKQPWEMTREEFNGAYPMKKSPYSNKGFRNELITDKAYSNPRGGAISARKEVIQKALAEGMPVPPSVLADYPDLKATAPAAVGVVTEPYVPRDKYQVEHPLLERTQPAVPGVETKKSMDQILTEEADMGNKLDVKPRAVDKTIPVIDVKKANLVDVTAKVDLKSVQVQFPSADTVVLDTKRRVVMFMHGTAPLEAIAVDKPQLKEWYGIEGAKLLGEVTRPAAVAPPMRAVDAPTGYQGPIDYTETAPSTPATNRVAQVAPTTPTLSKMETPATQPAKDLPEGLRPLVEEARKYRSAEEFAGAMENPTNLTTSGLFVGQKNLPVGGELIDRVLDKKGGEWYRVQTAEGKITVIPVEDAKIATGWLGSLADFYDRFVGNTPSLSPDLSTTLEKGPSATISNQKTGISTSTPVSPRGGTATGAGGGNNAPLTKKERLAEPLAKIYEGYRQNAGSALNVRVTDFKGDTWQLAGANEELNPFFNKVVGNKVGKKDFTVAQFDREWLLEQKANPASVPSALSAVPTAEVRVAEPGRVVVTFNKAGANPASVPTTPITSTSAPAVAPSLGNATPAHGLIDYSKIELNGTAGQTAPALTTKPPWEMTQAEWDAVPDPATIKPLKDGDRIVYHVLLKKGAGMTGKETVADALKSGIRRESTNTGIWVSLDKPVNDFGDMFVIELPESDLHIMNQQEAIVEKRDILPSDIRAFYPSFKADPRDTNYTRLDTSKFENGDTRQDWIDVAKQNGLPVNESPSPAPTMPENATATHGRIDYSRIELKGSTVPANAGTTFVSDLDPQGKSLGGGYNSLRQLFEQLSSGRITGHFQTGPASTTSQTSPKVPASVGNAAKKGFANYIQRTPGTTNTSTSLFTKFKGIRDGYIRFIANEYNWFFKSPLGGEWMTIAVAADDLMLEEYKNPFYINDAGEQVFVGGEFAPAILSRYLKASDVITERYLKGPNGVDLVDSKGKNISNPDYGKPAFGVFLQHLQRAGISTEPTVGLSAEKEALKQKHIFDARVSLANFQKGMPQLFQTYMAQANEIGEANKLLPEFYKGIISPETYANEKANPHYYVSLSAGKTDIFDRSGVAPLEHARGLTNLEEVVPPLEGLISVYVDAIRAQGINNAKREAVKSSKSAEVATTVLSDSIVHLKEDGVDRAYEVHDKDAGASIRNLTRSKWEVPSLVKRIFTAPTTLMRISATGANIAFGVFNPVRDIIQAAGLVPFTPTGLVKGTVKAFKSPGLSQWSKDYRDPTRPTGTKVTEAVKKIVEIVSLPSGVGESLGREVIGESIGSLGGTYLDKFYGYHAGTGFFALHGTFFNDFISGLIPFTRATIAVVRAAYRNAFYGLPIGGKGGTFSGKQGAEKILGKNFLATIIFAIIEMAAIKAAGKEKEYKLLRNRASFFYLPQSSGGWVKLPVPIGSAPIKAIVESLFGFKSDPMDVAGQTLNVIPGLEAFMLPPALTLYLQYKFNINFFTGSPINTGYDTPAKNPLEATIMKLGYTEEQAAMALQSFFADIPSQFQYVFDIVATGSSTQAFPLTKRFIVKDPTTSSNAAVDDFYALVDAAKESKNPALESLVNARASIVSNALHNAKLYPENAKTYIAGATDFIIATFALIAENPGTYGIKKFGPFSWRPKGNYEVLAP